MIEKKIISIIVITFNRIEYIKIFIEYLYLFTDYPFRLIVVDNGSEDGTKELILKLEKDGLIWKHVFNSENLKLAAAQTEGFKQVESDLFVVADDDMQVPIFKSPCWLTLLRNKILSDDNIGCINFSGARQSFRSFNIKRRPLIESRIDAEGGERFIMFKKLQKLIYNK